MIIKDMFAKPIGREIKGVIKVGQADEENIRQELEEYVVTRELQKRFAEFFDSYKRGITGNTDAMGVWISGFFGSGKSHLLKILSYLLANKEVDGKKAIEYFEDDNKIADSMVLADMQLAADTPADVILFNIDSKSDQGGKQDKEAIINVFLKVFNEMQGFCASIPYIADLERNLVANGKYEEFRTTIEEQTGDSWEELRDEFDFNQDEVVDALAAIDFMSEESARNFCEKASGKYEISIEDFAKMVKKYIDSKGNNHHVVFLIDEVGQYIGDNTQLMLNLQTVTEDLGRICKGKVWIIVTSQQDIDSVTKVRGNDFSKIQGRFDTRISLTSANVDEVIRERILKKTETAKDTLGIVYDEKKTIIDNLITFDAGAEKKLYAGRDNFATDYPFVPYQFNILGDVLTAIRTFSSSGKHLAEGERSMLALFKESAEAIGETSDGSIVSFDKFYDPLEKWLDHSHSGVISRALDNEHLNPNKEESCFEVNVLKVLFMIKHVKEMPATVDNVTSLMVSNIDEPRLELKEAVEQALKKLIRQSLVQQNGKAYIFLTNEEQEINKQIEAQHIDSGKVTGEIAKLIFDGIYAENKYRYPAHNGRYAFAFNKYIDEHCYKGAQNYELTLKILTPDYGSDIDDVTLKLMSNQGHNVIVAMPEDRHFIDELRAAMKIEKFMQMNLSNKLDKFEEIKIRKKAELNERRDRVHILLEEALKSSEIYVNGDKLQGAGREITGRINEAMGKLVDTVYHKLSYIDFAAGEAQIKDVLKKSDGSQLHISAAANEAGNKLALDDVGRFIQDETDIKHTKTSLKALEERFMKPPYGFVEADVQWIIAQLYRSGEIALSMNSEAVNSVTNTPDEIFRFLTRKEFADKLLTEKKKKVNEKQIKTVKEVGSALFNVATVGFTDEENSLTKTFQQYAARLKDELKTLEDRYYSHEGGYPGRKIAEDGRAMMIEIADIKSGGEFFETIAKNKDEYLDFAEDYAPVKTFFEGDQKKIFDKSLELMKIYYDSKTFIVNKEIEDTTAEIRSILKNRTPWGQIKNLPELNGRFSLIYADLLEEKSRPVSDAVEAARSRVFEVLEGKQCKPEFEDRCIRSFDELREKVKTCNNVAVLESIRSEVDALKQRLLDAIDKREQEIIDSQKPADPDPAGSPQPKPVTKGQKHVSIKSVTGTSSWKLETEEDVDKCVEEFKKQLINQLKEDTVTYIEF